MAELGALATARAIADGKLTAVEATEAAIARIEARDGPINAVVVRDFARARGDAKRADEAIARGERKPLLGVPMTVKESFKLAFTPHTWGFEPYKDEKAEEDGSTVRRLRDAGAVILGKTNVPVALADWQSVNPIYGLTVNPHDHKRSPGGSSGGAAAALASEMVPLEIGSDIGGSIRVPAHFCGVFGHKPTYGIVPLDGHPFPGSDGVDPVLAVAGPMARHAEDLAATIDVISETILPRTNFDSLKGVRIFVLTEHPAAAVSQDIVDAVNAVAANAEAAGAEIKRQSDLLPDLDQLSKDYMRMLLIQLAGGLPAQDQEPVTVATWFEMQGAQARCQRAWARFFEEFDALLCPVLGCAAMLHTAEPDLAKRDMIIDGKPTRYGAQFAWISMATYAGLPATSAPMGRNSEGLPINMQIITAKLRDQDAIALAGLLSDGAIPIA